MPSIGVGDNRARLRPRLAVWAVGCAVLVTVGTTMFTQAVAAPPPRVEIGAGVLEGIREGAGGNLFAFKGIPYAAPPVGEWRWKPPRPAPAWSGVRSARELGALCPQPDRGVVIRRRLTSALGGDPSQIAGLGPMSEDCLSLNVWTTKVGARTPRPVMVWLHGGAFSYGSGSNEAAVLAHLGVVVVTVNYRLGLLGSLAHPALARESAHDSSGTYGLLDQIEALRWVQRHIAVFGGDPTRVTVFGQSAGGAAVLQLVASPLAKGLLHRAIAQSGGLGESRPRADAEAKGRQIADGLVGPHADALTALRALSAERMIASGGGPFDPVTDGWVLPNAVPTAVVASSVPLLVGATANEAVVFAVPKDLKVYHGVVAESGPVWEKRLLELYPATTGEQAYDALLRFVTDRDFVCPSRYLAARRAAPTWLYRVSAASAPDPDAARLGAYHGSDVRYLFRMELGVPLGTSAERVGEAMRRYWVRFAVSGDPNGPTLPNWPAYARAKAERLELDDPIHAVSALDNRGCDAFDEISDATYGVGAAAAHR